jgi:hypothetical protein
VPEDKRSPQSRPGAPEPEAAEVESARLLANEHRDQLRAHGLDDEEIRKLADAFVAVHPALDPADFADWALRRRDDQVRSPRRRKAG